MKNQLNLAVLFDFDGVIMDTEPQYTLFWDEKGKAHHPEIPNFGHHIKGQTLTQIYSQYFRTPAGLQDEITRDLLDYETRMKFEYIAGAQEFMLELRKQGFKTAIVTSSNDAKMANAHRAHPELREMVDAIITADRVTHSKPHPECFLLGAETLGMPTDRCVVFEDSFHGIEAGNRAGMKVVGLSTTNPEEEIRDKCTLTIPNFVHFSYKILFSLLQ